MITIKQIEFIQIRIPFSTDTDIGTEYKNYDFPNKNLWMWWWKCDFTRMYMK